MNEDEQGITPPNVTAMTIDRKGGGWWIIIEQGNGDVLKEIELTEMERVQLACLLDFGWKADPGAQHMSFVDYSR